MVLNFDPALCRIISLLKINVMLMSHAESYYYLITIDKFNFSPSMCMQISKFRAHL